MLFIVCLDSRETIGRRSVGERSPCAPQSSNLKGLSESEIRQLVLVGICEDEVFEEEVQNNNDNEEEQGDEEDSEDDDGED